MKIITTRRTLSAEQVTAALDELAQEYSISRGCYDESGAQRMSEFDALKWVTLCSQRSVLQKREYESRTREWEVPAQFLGIYETKDCTRPEWLENIEESLTELAA